MNSMTGYAFKEAIDGDLQISVEMKSVNSRFLDLSVNMPSFMAPLESRIREKFGEKVVRGKVDLTIRLHDNAPETKISVNTAVAKAYADAIREVSDVIGTFPKDIAELVLAQDGVLNAEKSYDAEKYWSHIEPIFDEVYEVFLESRAKEGEKLKADLTKKLEILDNCAAFFAEWQPKMEAKFKEQIIQKFHDMLGNQVDEQRVLTETAAMMDAFIAYKQNLEAFE